MKRDHRPRRGQGLVEYGLAIALIAIVCILAVSGTGTTVKAHLQSSGDRIEDVAVSAQAQINP